MHTQYTLPDGSKISSFLWDDIQQNETIRGFAEISRIKPGGWRGMENIKKTLLKDDHGVYINWRISNGKVVKVYLNDFDYMDYPTLVEKVQECIDKKDRYIVSDDDILATFMRCTDDVSIEAKLPVADWVTPFGFALCGDKEAKAVCHLSEKEYPKHSWSYKITMEPDTSKLGVYSKSMYFSDFCSMLKKGDCGFRLLKKGEA